MKRTEIAEEKFIFSKVNERERKKDIIGGKKGEQPFRTINI
jgi:hypothetical protein